MSQLIIQKAAIKEAPQAIFIMGPTASGKTDLAVACVQQFNCEIISVDSALVYKRMDIGTAKPDAEILAIAPHHLINVIEPNQAYSAATFRQSAFELMQAITAKGKIPLLVGGTMLYYKALQEGLSVLPSANPEIRQQLETQAKQLGWQAMHERLQGIDPTAAARIHPNDPQRIQRALEVYEISGQSMTQLWQQQEANALPYDVIKIALLPKNREMLRQRIAQRFHQMLELGFVDEVRGLKDNTQLALNMDMPSMRCVGYRQVWEYLQGELSFDEMVDKAIIATRQLAKRQMTWLRKESQCNTFDANPDIFTEIMQNLKTSLL